MARSSASDRPELPKTSAVVEAEAAVAILSELNSYFSPEADPSAPRSPNFLKVSSGYSLKLNPNLSPMMKTTKTMMGTMTSVPEEAETERRN